MKPNFATITGRFLGFTPEQWEAEKEKSGLSDQQLIDIIQTSAKVKAHGQAAKQFYRSGKLGSLNNE